MLTSLRSTPGVFRSRRVLSSPYALVLTVLAGLALAGCGGGGGSNNNGCPAGQHSLITSTTTNGTTTQTTTCIADSRFAGNWSGTFTQVAPGTETGRLTLNVDVNGAVNGTIAYGTSTQTANFTGKSLVDSFGNFTFSLLVFSQNVNEQGQLVLADNGHLNGNLVIPSGANASQPIQVTIDLAK